MNPRVYVARKDCGCIVAAFPVNMDKAIKGELMKQFSKAGYDLEQTTQGDVRDNYHITCDHNRPPLLAMMDERTAEGRMVVDAGEGVSSTFQFPEEMERVGEGASDLEEEHSFDENEGDDNEPTIEETDESDEDEGADETDVNDLAGDITPEAEEADELLTQDEF